ncbi:SpvB/TcaC N-terminal domain-containing protein [Pontibacter burrus]|uniref:RHS repeat protein n=1 Tax=Pontibacter burrus TaxID=2704466 RepID=A0A6B3LQR4_9BACT|nr:SpvB/TcaC N-terminal domain-containing protein [Pontibacter burrus]NEM97415.1 hypothetical protein [Pontibacter burrus]
MVPLSPTAAALGKYVDIPVSLSTGTPEISIPLYEVNGRDLSLPISLNYHAGGFKVGELASWVGLGWSLNAGGMVGRTIRGLPDDGSYLTHFATRSGHLNEVGDYSLLSFLTKGTVDGQPDVYFYNFDGYSGKFIQTDREYLMPKQPLRVTGSVIAGWEITNPKGDTYFFKETEKSLVRGENTAEANVTSWLLSKIVSANGTDTIYFDYKQATYRENLTLSETKVFDQETYILGATPQVRYTDVNASLTTMYSKQLERIRFSQGRVEFISSASREDLRPRDNLDPHQPLRLDAIKVYDKQDKLIKHYSFHYDYFSVGTTPEDKRLRLNTLLEMPVGNDVLFQSPRTHAFTYNMDQQLPRRTSKAMDHWGYFNKATGNTSLIPKHTFSNGTVAQGANRDPNMSAPLANLLTRITYPTGGFAQYEYEAHDYSFIENRPVEETLLKTTPHTYYAEAWYYDPKKSPAENTRATSATFYVATAQDVTISTSVYTQTAPSAMKASTFSTMTANGFLGAMVQVFDSKGSQVAVFDHDDNKSHTLRLQPGHYYVTATATDASTYASIYFTYYSYSSEILKLKLAGGVRVRKTVLHDGMDPQKDIVKTYHYRLSEDSTLSSGSLNAAPSYDYTYTNWEYVWQHENLPEPDFDEGVPKHEYSYMALTSSAPNASGSSAPVMYREVTVVQGSGAGKSTYAFTSHFESPDGQGGRAYPFSPPTDKSWQRGRLLSQTDYDIKGNIVRKLLNSYTVDGATRNVLSGYKAVYASKHPDAASETYNANWFNNTFYQEEYQMLSEFQYLDRSEERIYTQDNSGQYVAQVTTFHYDRLPVHTQLTRQEQSLENGMTRVTRYTYPSDYDFPAGALLTPAAQALQQMKTNHIISPVIEKTTWQRTVAGMALVGGELTEFNTFHVGTRPLVLPHKVYLLEQAAPVAETAFTPLSVATEGGSYSVRHDSRYALRTTLLAYNSSGRLQELLDADGRRFVYLWGYRNQFPVAEIENATLAGVETADDIL